MKYYMKDTITDENIAKQLKEMLAAHDKEFIPRLSDRRGTTEKNLTGSASDEEGVQEYYDELMKQSFIYVTDETYTPEKLVGFMSYIMDYESNETACKHCIYVSTIIVDEAYRGYKLTNDFYMKLLSLSQDRMMPIVTRTWSTNNSHIHILQTLDFELRKRIVDDRGEGIDTVYYCKEYSKEELKPLQKLRAFELAIPLGTTVLLFLLTIISAFIFANMTETMEVGRELMLAMATSLLVSAICLGIDVFSKYKSMSDDIYLSDMRAFGIKRLTFDKQSYLFEEISKATDCVWISGYRLILTASITQSLQAAAARGVQIRILISPFWKSGFKAAFGDNITGDENSSVIKNYIKTIKTVLLSGDDEDIEVRFTDNIFFNDIYRVDEQFITSPYSSVKKSGKLITARDYFTIIVSSQSQLYQITEDEYVGIWENSRERLDNAKFLELFRDNAYLQMTLEEKSSKLKSCIIAEE